jgi:two-component system, OmpR family, KDP operon response regulator KdpE
MMGFPDRDAEVSAQSGQGGRSEGSPPRRRFRTGDLEIDVETRTVNRSGVPVDLTNTEWSLLEALSQHPGESLTRRWLLERVWGEAYADDVDLLRVFIRRLRTKIEADASQPKIILTVPGIGYGWVLRSV